MNTPPTYAVVTPVRNEAEHLTRLADALAAQTLLPRCWLIVDNGSTDDTPVLAARFSRQHSWVHLVTLMAGPATVRGGPIVQAFQAGLGQLPEQYDVVVKLDADTSMDPDYFARLTDAFVRDPSLGIASGSCFELEGGEWRQRHMTADHVWGASRAYRWDCLETVLPLEERMGWDGIDALKAQLAGWSTMTVLDLPFRHHRAEGARDGARWRAYAAQGRAAYFMGYRPSYLVIRALNAARREPSAVAMVWGFAAGALARDARCSDVEVREHLRREQRMRALPLRAREALGRRAA